MKIGILLHPYGEKTPAGLSRTIFEWTRGMLLVDQKNEYSLFVKEKPRGSLELPGNNWRVEVLGGGIFWLDRIKKFPAADVYLFNTPVLPLFWKPRRACALALDFAYAFPQFQGETLKERMRARVLKIYHKQSLKRAHRIVAISHATKKDIMNLFGIPAEKISVIHCGFKNICALPEIPVPLPEKFFLFAGVFKERKNVLNVARAFAEIARAHPDVHLVLVGKGEGAYADRVRATIQSAGIQKNAHFPGYLNDNELSYTYKKALALVFPSFIEGFGYPTLEGMSCGLPVITSNISSLPEVAGDAALLVNPHDYKDIARAMDRIARDSAIRAELIKRGKARAAQFSWEKAGKELLELLKQLE